MLRTTDGGKTWEGMSEEQKTKTLPYANGMPEPLDGVHFINSNDGLAVGDLGVILRTNDGGKTWLQVLKKDENTGASDVALDPSNPNIVFAGLWQARRSPWNLADGGPARGAASDRHPELRF
jgi:photosystem II stability/assembly factor-like uncharacterized protein